MKRGEFIFERSLMVITLVFGMLSLINEAFIIAFACWWWMLGIGQLWRSIEIAKTYWKNRKIRSAIMIYWVAAGTDLATLFSRCSLSDESYEHLYPYTIYFPACIAAYWCFTCWYFGERKDDAKPHATKSYHLKRSNALFEHIIFGLTVLFGVGLYFNNDYNDTLIAGFIWLIALTLIQATHSFVIANAYWKNRKIRLALLFYWIAGGVHLVLPHLTNKTFIDEESVWTLFIPVMLATYLWFINWFLQDKKQPAMKHH